MGAFVFSRSHVYQHVQLIWTIRHVKAFTTQNGAREPKFNPDEGENQFKE